MIDRTRKLMLLLLAAVGTASAFAVVSTWVGRTTADLAARTAEYERRLQRLNGKAGAPTPGVKSSRKAAEELAAHEAALERERSHFYEEGELSPAEFASQLQRSLAAAGLAVRRYRPVEEQAGKGERRLVELVVEGRADGLLSFLEGVSRREKYSPIPSIAIHSLPRGGRVEATLRIGYEEIGLGVPR